MMNGASKTMNILVPIDFSPVTTQVLGHASVLAAGLGGRLYLVHVAAPDPEFVGYDAGPQTVRDQVARKYREQHQQLQAEADALRAGGLDAVAVLVQGPSVETILSEAERVCADLIVMGSHGHGAVYRLLAGSVSQGVLRRAPCPVLVVPASPPDASD